MFFSTTVATLALGAALIASPVTAAVHDITVGGPSGLVFSPEAIFAAVGDQIVFHFQAKNHTATQSSLAAPCSHAEGGFDSGFMPVPANQTDNFPTYTVNVTDTKPLWAFCNQAVNTPAFHCGKGMVFSANCGAEGQPNSFTNFKSAALAIGAQLAAAASSGAPPAASASPAASPASSAPPAAATTGASTTASAAGSIHTVKVGGATPIFDPANITAAVGDQVLFQFQAGTNHTVTQSGFAAPCVRLTNATTGAPGFDSGFQAVAQGTAAAALPTWSLTVNSTAPIWAYCAQSGHCGKGMVFSINAVEGSNKSFADFQGLAKQQNGTAANGTAGTSGTAAPANSGAGVLRVSGLAIALGAVAAFFSL